MKFSLSRCPPKGTSNPLLSEPSEPRARAPPKALKRDQNPGAKKPKKRPPLPIPSFRSRDADLERLEQEFLNDTTTDPPLSKKLKAPIPNFASPLFLSSSEDDEEEPFIPPMFRNKSQSITAGKVQRNAVDTPYSNQDYPTGEGSSQSLELSDSLSRNTNTAPSNEVCQGVLENVEDDDDGGDEAFNHKEYVMEPDQKAFLAQNSVRVSDGGVPSRKGTTEPDSNAAVAMDVGVAADGSESGESDSRNATVSSELPTSSREGRSVLRGRFNALEPEAGEDLERTDSLKKQIDALFKTTDMTGTTVKTFLVQLRNRLDRTLSKREKQIVKDHLRVLVSGRRSSSSSANKSGPSTTESEEELTSITSKRDALINASTGQAKYMQPKRHETKSNSSSMGNKPGIPADRLSASQYKSKTPYPRTSTKYAAVDIPNMGAESPTGAEIGHSPLQPKRKRSSARSETTTKKSTSVAKELRRVDSSGFDDESHSPASESAQKKEKCGRPPKVKIQQQDPTTSGAPDLAKKPVEPKGRKRTRKGTCALCTTCPCQKLHDEDATGRSMATFARSDTAMEKALIRRVQKLEKSCELHEGNADMVRRKLKQHRREMWKKKEREKQLRNEGVGTKQQQHFLPGAKVFETLQAESMSLPAATIQTACKAIFPDTPCYQPTLTQLLGASRAAGNFINNSTSTQQARPLETILEGSDEDTASQKEINIQDTTLGQIEYVHEATQLDEIDRLQWQKLSTEKRIETGEKFSVWRTLNLSGIEAKIYQEPPTQLSQSIPPSEPASDSWDRLFASSSSTEKKADDGIDQLVGLFGGSETPSAEGIDDEDSPSCHSPDSVVQLSMLTQRGKAKTSDLITVIESDKTKLTWLNHVCPDWKENLAFAMKQDDENTVSKALEEVRRKHDIMMETKRKIIEAWERQSYVLEVFEKGLLSSLDRLSAGLVPHDMSGDSAAAQAPDGIEGSSLVTYK